MTESVTVGDAVTIGQEEEAVHRYTSSSGSQRGGARARAKTSLTASVKAITDSDEPGVSRVQDAAVAVADSIAERTRIRFAQALAGPALWDARPPTLAEARQQVHEAVNHLQGGLWQALRFGYGYLVWLPLILAVYAAVWVFRSPWGPPIAAAVGFVIWTCK